MAPNKQDGNGHNGKLKASKQKGHPLVDVRPMGDVTVGLQLLFTQQVWRRMCVGYLYGSISIP